MQVILIAVYACINLSDLYLKSSEPLGALKHWHFMLGACADPHRYGPYPPLAVKQHEMADKRLANMAASKARTQADCLGLEAVHRHPGLP